MNEDPKLRPTPFAAPIVDGSGADAPQDPNTPTPPGGVVGVLGGGQLGRMLAMAAKRLGIKTHIYSPEVDPPAASAADAVTRGSEDYYRNLANFAKACDVVTLEFENVPADALTTTSVFAPTRPGRHALEIAQDRVAEKAFIRSIGAHTTAFRPVDGLADLREGLIAYGGSGFLKTRRLGYDGRGQMRLSLASPNELDDAVREAYAAIGRASAILEAPVAFERELSVIVARGVDGETRCYDPAENVHENGVLRRSLAPGDIPPDVAAAAQDVARRVVEGLDYVGVMGVEFFQLPDGRLLVNEIAPRVHNSGHWTLEACVVSQFEQHIRAVCGWPLGSTERHSDVEMVNLLGDEVAGWRGFAEERDVAIHLYGKAEARPGRKMGHVTRLLGPARRRSTS